MNNPLKRERAIQVLAKAVVDEAIKYKSEKEKFTRRRYYYECIFCGAYVNDGESIKERLKEMKHVDYGENISCPVLIAKDLLAKQ